MSAQKQPINRKIVYLILIAVVVLGVAGAVVVTINDPREQVVAKDEAKRQEEIQQMQPGSVQAGSQSVQEMARQAEQRVGRPTAEDDPDRQAFDEFLGGNRGAPRAPSGSAGMPQLDEQLLRDLAEAEAIVGRRPDVGRATGGLMPLPADSGGGGFGGTAEPRVIRHEKYEREGEGMFSAGSNRVEGPDTSEALTPEVPPSNRVINEGVGVPAVLMSRIDTRIPGPITARVNRTIYDSRTHRIPLIPQGSRLVGSYSSSVGGGDDRVAVVMERLILPDGRSIRLPQFPVAGPDGTLGVDGNYKSNLRRAIGPTFFVALLGQVADRQINREIPSNDPAGAGFAPPPPSVLQQTIPKVNETIMRRGEGAEPYMLVQPGKEVRVVLAADLEIPEAGGPR